jgi:hypothetical protein
MSSTDTDQAIAQERRTLLLLSRNQSTREQIEAAGRHLAALHAAMVNKGRERETDTDREDEGR